MTNTPQQFPGQQPQYNPGNGQQPPFYPGNATPPPTKPKKPWFKRFWVWAIIVVAFIAIVTPKGGGHASTAASPSVTQSAVQEGQSQPSEATTSQTAAAATTAASKAKAKLTLDDGWELDRSNQFAVTVNGYVSNNTDKPINNYVQITFDALDSAGANLGTCLANTNTIDANGKWKFQAMCGGTPDDVASVRLKEITGF